jgi:NAD(P)-dependent dehydrogenase (short-subunit alcohol dehydrogenase family)
MSERNKVLITGASKRIGKSIALNLAKHGYDIAIHYNKSKTSAISLVEELNSLKVRSSIFKLDLMKIDKIEEWFDEINKVFGTVNVLINNASVFEYDSLKSSSLSSLNKHLDINLKAPFLLSKFFVKNLKSQKGNIINILDQRVLNISPYFTSYTISKSALHTLTKSLALSLAPKIRVNAVAPGPTLRSIRQNEKEFKEQIKRTPLQNQVSLNEINNAINFLLNNKSVTGQTIMVDSGQNLGWAHTKSKKFIDD